MSSYLKGVDPEYDGFVSKSLEELLKRFGEALIDSYFQGSVKDKKTTKDNLKNTIKSVLKDLKIDSENIKKEKFEERVKEMVRFMPYQELANMAESLINITSLKRRVSAERETVGGPVDVAVISKSEGFVWIKRKHYFEKKFNPRFYTRLSKQLGGMEDDHE